MKKVLSISMGSASRDHTTRQVFLDQEFEMTRMGATGDFERYIELYKAYDGHVDAFGVGGMEFYLDVAGRKYYFRDAKKVRKAIKISKVGDGNGVKSLLVQRAVSALEKHLNEQEGRSLKGLKAMKTTAVDRYGMAKALVDAGCDVTFCDFMFALGLPVALHSLSAVRVVAALLLPVITNLPYTWLYPLGSEQDKPPQPKWEKYYAQSEVIAGDFLQVRRHLPDNLKGKIIITNTTTAKNVEELRQRGLHILVTTTPRLEGRSFGTNVMEATLLALMDKPQAEVNRADFLALIEAIPLLPNIEVLNP